MKRFPVLLIIICCLLAGWGSVFSEEPVPSISQNTSYDIGQLLGQKWIDHISTESQKEFFQKQFFELMQPYYAQISMQKPYDFILITFCPEFLKLKMHRTDRSVLKQLTWELETNKPIYRKGEPITLRITLKNTSDQDVHLLDNYMPYGFVLNSMDVNKISKDKKEKVDLTKGGTQYSRDAGISVGNVSCLGHLYLKPGERCTFSHSSIVLNTFYDLSLPGTYELSFYTRNFLDETPVGEYPKPSSFIQFVIENDSWIDKSISWPDTVVTPLK